MSEPTTDLRMLRRLKSLPVAVVLLLAVTTTVTAWNAAGHRLIAMLAYDQMPEEARVEVVRILKKHPRFEEDFQGEMPQKIRSASTDVQDRWIFAQAAVWPDIARRQPDYHHGTWHYINEPLFLTESYRRGARWAWFAEGVKVNLSRTWKPGQRLDSLNAVQAFKRAIALLKKPTTPDPEKAVLLCWVLHISGDLHQPLHSVALFSQDLFPKGDRGGNGVKVGGSNLHSYWDGTLGRRDSSYAKITGWVEEMRADDELSTQAAEATGQLEVGRWVDESRALAEGAYGPTVKKALIEAEIAGASPSVTLSDKYKEMARKAARMRAVQAGARTAAVLDELLAGDDE